MKQQQKESMSDAGTVVDVKSRLKQSYDAIAPAYNAWAMRTSGLRLEFLNRLLHLLPPPPPPPTPATPITLNGAAPDSESAAAAPSSSPSVLTALELGCGAGVPVTQALLSYSSSSPGVGGRTFHVTANDLSSTQIALGKQALGGEHDETRVRWIQGDMMDLDFPAESFDVIIALYSLIHLPRGEQIILLGRMAKWLKKKPGGLALVNFGAEEAEHAVMDDWLGPDGWMFWSSWGVETTLCKVREETGLEVVESKVTTDADGVDASFLWVIMRAKEAEGG